MLSEETIAQIAAELAEADRTHGVIPRITARYPEATVEDSTPSRACGGIRRSRPAAGWSGARSA